MTRREKIIFTWSSGKDSALALYKLQQAPEYEVVALLTNLTQNYDRVSMHGVRSKLLDQQAQALNLPLEKFFITKDASCEEYQDQMAKVLLKYKKQGVTKVGFGDIFLEDIKEFREKQLAKINMATLFPLWKIDSQKLANEIIDQGFKAIVVCVDNKFLDQQFVGREYDKQFLNDLPSTVDPCGENGEFHSFVYDGPNFKNKIPVTKGEIVLRDNRFWYCDLV